MKRLARAVLQLLLVAVTLAVALDALRFLGGFDSRMLPRSVEISSALLVQLKEPRFWLDARSTLIRSVTGLALAFLVGAPLGIAIGASRLGRWLGLPVVDFLRSVPVTSLYPVVVLTLGIGDQGKIGMVFWSCALVIALPAAASFSLRSRIRHQVARLYGASRPRLLFDVSLREAVPSVLTGLRIAAGIAFIVSSLTEMFMGAEYGLGQGLMEAYSTYDLPRMYAYIAGLGTFGFALNRVCVFLEEQTAPWSRR